MSRRDLWLCAMTPTLHLLRGILRGDGLLLISIDANEAFHLTALCDEIFGEANRFGAIAVRNNPRGRRFGTELAVEHEYLLAYAKDAASFTAGRLGVDEKRLGEYPLTDAEGKRYRLLGLRKRGAISSRGERPNLHYPLYIDPKNKTVSTEKGHGKVEITPRRSDGTDGVWRWSAPKIDRQQCQLTARMVRRRSGAREWDIFQLDYLVRSDGVPAGRLFPSVWQGPEFNNERGRDQLREIFGASAFDYPKPVDLVKNAIMLANAGGDDIVLDCFAGSGTTCQAVMELNASDGAARRFIAIEREPFADHVTAERVRRLIKGIPSSKNKLLRAGLGGGFSYFTAVPIGPDGKP
jgi:adenine-specific DNA-methyltransferase